MNCYIFQLYKFHIDHLIDEGMKFDVTFLLLVQLYFSSQVKQQPINEYILRKRFIFHIPRANLDCKYEDKQVHLDGFYQVSPKKVSR